MKFNRSFILRMLNDSEKLNEENEINPNYKFMRFIFKENNIYDKYLNISFSSLLLLFYFFLFGDEKKEFCINNLSINSSNNPPYEPNNKIYNFCTNKYKFQDYHESVLLFVVVFNLILNVINIVMYKLSKTDEYSLPLIIITKHRILFSILMKLGMKFTFVTSYILTICFVILFDATTETFVNDNKNFLIFLNFLFVVFCIIRSLLFLMKALILVFMIPVYLTSILLAIYEDKFNYLLNKIVETRLYEYEVNKTKNLIKVDFNVDKSSLLEKKEIKSRDSQKSQKSSKSRESVKSAVNLDIEGNSLKINNEEISKKSIHLEQCPICLDNIQEGDLISTLPCNKKHTFHTYCIEFWLIKNSNCPICRFSLSEIINKIIENPWQSPESIIEEINRIRNNRGEDELPNNNVNNNQPQQQFELHNLMNYS